jgi:hypothetical protein
MIGSQGVEIMNLFASLHNRSGVAYAALALVAIGTALFEFVPLNHLVQLTNGLFLGSMAAIVVAYGQLIWNAILGVKPYDRVRQMTLGFALCWLAYGLSVVASVYLRSTDAVVTSTYLTVCHRLIAIVAAILQVTAPDFGLGIFHGRDRKMLWASGSVGLAVAAFVTYAQYDTILSDF